jgi:hypothetical protein
MGKAEPAIKERQQMLETDDYLRLAASNFKVAEAKLKDTEDELLRLVEKLENSLELLRKIPQDELLLQEQLDTIVRESQPADISEPHLVSS